jgi:hypothetical protein
LDRPAAIVGCEVSNLSGAETLRVYEVGKGLASLDWSVILGYRIVYFLVIREERTCTDARWYLLHSLDLHSPAKTLLQESAPMLTRAAIVIRECQPSCAIRELLTCSLPVAYSDKHVTKHSWRCLDVRSSLAGRAASFSSTCAVMSAARCRLGSIFPLHSLFRDSFGGIQEHQRHTARVFASQMLRRQCICSHRILVGACYGWSPKGHKRSHPLSPY